MVELTQEYLKSKIFYDPESGKFYRREYNGQIGNEITTICEYKKSKKFYFRFMLNYKIYLAHRLAFLYMTGRLPDDQVDHINGDGLDNKWMNLREVSHNENSKNRKLNSNNTSGICGVTWSKAREKWTVQISVNGSRKTLGYFDSLTEAKNRREDANKIYGFHENHGLR